MGNDAGVLERRLEQGGFERVAGCDEVGRGALAGPLFAAAVILPPGIHIEGLRDSKLCTAAQRQRLDEQIREVALAWSIVRVRHDRIDRFGLQRCNLQALRRALKNLGMTPDYVLVDGLKTKRWRLSCPALTVKKADVVSANVAAASIVAKVARDRAMSRYHRRFPIYGFRTNKGYGTAEHWAALKQHGPSDIHRLSFYGVMGFPDDPAASAAAQARDLDDPVDGIGETELEGRQA